ncbi:GNAT family N-acetyltransferase [Dyadobacter sp. NIV53]|uniref:GNAT family N-acetyltransferase n=1 Tax=Dyadobacter sp. NIV53 TaxID=2861765 RepID=UPI001C88499D|nr:GNAT family N-acetyltransferase [Dyadobacter sp. NIV53]
MPLEIRKATVADAQNIARFSRKSFHDSFADQNTKENMDKFMTVFSEDALAAEVKSPENIFYIALDNNTIAGYIKLLPVQNPLEDIAQKTVEICRIYVDKERIGQGIGNILMKKGLEAAVDLGAKTIWLGVWEHNSNALSFYKKWGFERFSEHIFMLGDDRQTDWLLKKELS